MASLYTRLDQNKHPRVQVIETSEQFQKMLSEIRKSWKEVSLGIGWGGAFGVASHAIVRKLYDEGIQPVEYVGTSVGAIIGTLFSLGYTDEKYVDFFLSGLTKIIRPDRIPLMLIAKLIPFVCEFPKGFEGLHEQIIDEYEHFSECIKKYQKDIIQDGTISTNGLEKALRTCFNIPPSSRFSLRKITLDDAKGWGFGRRKKGEWSIIRVIAGEISPNPLRKFFRYSIRPIVFHEGHLPLLDILLASACPGLPRMVRIWERKIMTTDGYFAGQNFPSDSTFFEVKNSCKVVIHTDNNFILTRKLLPDYGAWLDYVIRPDMRAVGGWLFAHKNALRFYKEAARSITG